MGGWVEGDPVGNRVFLDLPEPFPLERGRLLPSVRVAYETWGTLEADGGNAVLVEHALTGDSHVVGPAGPGHPTPGWWDGLIGPGAPLDTDRFFVVCANVLGGCQGTTGPSSLAPDDGPWGARFPEVTVGDQVRVEAVLADALGIDRWACVVGGSMGGWRRSSSSRRAPSAPPIRSAPRPPSRPRSARIRAGSAATSTGPTRRWTASGLPGGSPT